MFNRNSEEFFWYVNFGITKNNAVLNLDKALDHCISSAYNDACRHINYLYSIDKLKEMKKKSEADKKQAENYEKHKEVFNQKCSSIIWNCIQDLISENTIEFDSWHRELCTGEGATDLRLNDIPPGLFKDDLLGLTIGQRQKWVNMTLKNMLIMGLWDNSLIRYENKIHVPIDNKILVKAKESGIKTCLPNEWNNINSYEDYMRFQTELRDKLNVPPIQWEWDTWLR